MLAFHKAAIRLHKQYRVLTGGSLLFLHGDYNILSYARFDSQEQMVVVFNNNEDTKVLSFQVWMAEIGRSAWLRRIFFTDENGFDQSQEILVPVEFGEITISMPAFSAAVFRAEI